MTTAYDAWKTHDPREDEPQDDLMDGLPAFLAEADWQKEIGEEGVHFLLVDIYEGRDMALVRADLLNYLACAYTRHKLNLQQEADHAFDPDDHI